jgi:hypothetical protein
MPQAGPDLAWLESPGLEGVVAAMMVGYIAAISVE